MTYRDLLNIVTCVMLVVVMSVLTSIALLKMGFTLGELDKEREAVDYGAGEYVFDSDYHRVFH